MGLTWAKGIGLTPLQSQQDTWLTALPILSQAVGTTLEMKVLVNDQTWMIGANAKIMVPKDSSRVDLYPWFNSQQGAYQVLQQPIYSPQLKNSRLLIIYTPPSYYENTLKPMQNVLVMHDGQNLFNDSTSFAGRAWRCQNTINSLVVQGNMDEVFIIGVYNTPDRINELTYSYDPTQKAGGKGDLYLDFLENTVVPYVKGQFRIQVPQSNLGILGSSLGGLISCYAGWTRAKTYSRAGCMSSSFWWNSEDFNNTILVKNPPPKQMTLYLDSGNAGPSNDDVTQTITVRNHISRLGFTMGTDLFYYLDNGGQHSEKYWGDRFHVPMTDLYPPAYTATQPVQ